MRLSPKNGHINQDLKNDNINRHANAMGKESHGVPPLDKDSGQLMIPEGGRIHLSQE